MSGEVQQQILHYALSATLLILVVGYIDFRRKGNPDGITRPGWLWVILLYYVILIPLPLFGFMSLVSPDESAAHSQAHLNAMRPEAFDFFSYLFTLLASVIGAAYMFWFRRFSVNIFMAILAMMLLRYVVIVARNEAPWFQPSAYVGLIVTLVIILYGRRLVRERVLQ